MDTLNTPTYRKKLKRLTEQDPGESRRRWQHVTAALKVRDVEAATEAKHTVRKNPLNDSHSPITIILSLKLCAA